MLRGAAWNGLIVVGLAATFAWSESRASAWQRTSPQATPKAPSLKVEHGLARRIDFDFTGKPLDEALADVAARLKIEIALDSESLAAAGVAENAPVSFFGPKLRAEQGLEWMLGDLGLALGFVKGKATVRARAAVESEMQSRRYSLTRLGAIGADATALSEAIRFLARKSWSDVGGPGSVTVARGKKKAKSEAKGKSKSSSAVLEVVQSPSVQRKVRDLLADLESAARDNSQDAPLPEVRAKVAIENVPLVNALDRLARQFGTCIRLETAAGVQGAPDASAPVSLAADNASLSEALDKLLTPLGLEATRNGAMMVSSKPKPSRYEVRVYRIAAGVPSQAAGNKLIQEITTQLAPDTWAGNGGAGSIILLPPAGSKPSALVVGQSTDVHEKIAAFLATKQ